MTNNRPTIDDPVLARPADADRVHVTEVEPEPAAIDTRRSIASQPLPNAGVYRPDWSTDAEASALLAARDSVRWGSIVAGLVTALTTLLLLSLLGVGIGITAADPASAASNAQALGIGGAAVAAVIGLLAFFVGGFVAARTSATVGRPAGALNGFLVWALGVIAVLLLAALGLSSILGAAGNIVGQTGVPSVDAPAVNPNQAADAVRNSAIGAFISLALPALAATLGGFVGAAKDVDERTAAV